VGYIPTEHCVGACEVVDESLLGEGTKFDWNLELVKQRCSIEYKECSDSLVQNKIAKFFSYKEIIIKSFILCKLSRQYRSISSSQTYISACSHQRSVALKIRDSSSWNVETTTIHQNGANIIAWRAFAR
jgi:hypothetical protein